MYLKYWDIKLIFTKHSHVHGSQSLINDHIYYILKCLWFHFFFSFLPIHKPTTITAPAPVWETLPYVKTVIWIFVILSHKLEVYSAAVTWRPDCVWILAKVGILTICVYLAIPCRNSSKRCVYVYTYILCVCLLVFFTCGYEHPNGGDKQWGGHLAENVRNHFC